MSLALALPSACSLLLSLGGGDPIKAKIPGHEVEVSIEIPGFKQSHKGETPGRTLLLGDMPDGVVISVLWEQNFPFVATADCPDVYSKESAYRKFTVDDKSCCQFKVELRNLIGESQFYAFLATNDFLFTIHVSRGYPLKSGDAKELKRSEMEAIVRSLSVSGTADRSKYSYPDEVYTFRDEAAKLAVGQLDWVQQQCSARPDDWVPAFYLGELAYNARKIDPALRGYQGASEILAKKAQRSPKETRALLVALDHRAGCFASQKKFDQAGPVCQQILDATKGEDAKTVKAFREEALFNLACCNAMTAKPEQALKFLRQAIEAQPEFKKRAAEEAWLASLRPKAEFKKLVGG